MPPKLASRGFFRNLLTLLITIFLFVGISVANPGLAYAESFTPKWLFQFGSRTFLGFLDEPLPGLEAMLDHNNQRFVRSTETPSRELQDRIKQSRYNTLIATQI